MKSIKSAHQLQIGDVVKIAQSTDGFSHCTVVNKTDEFVVMVRPFVHLADFTYTGGVLNYIGTETIKVPLNNPIEYIWFENIFRGQSGY